jgi:ABC-type glycerol-3-phosphate transport system substrate-binding protein
MKKAVFIFLAAALLLTAACGADPDAGHVTPARNTPAPPPPGVFVTVTPNEFHIKPVIGSDYAEGIYMSELEPNQIHVETMMTIDWDYIVGLQNSAPFHQYEATTAWRETFPGGNVTIRTVPLNEHTTSLTAWTAGGEAPDIIPVNEFNYPLWPKRGLTADMKWYADNLDLYNVEIFNKNLMDQYAWRDEYPWAVINEAVSRNYVIYNKTLFDAAGEITPFQHWQDGNWNWSQFVRTAKAMTVGEESYGFTGWGLSHTRGIYPMTAVDSNGTAQLLIGDPKFIRYMTEIANLYQNDGAARPGWGLQEWEALMVSGTDAMAIATTGFFVRMNRAAARRQTGADIRIAPLWNFDPNGETEPIASAHVWGYSISRAARNPVGAAEYIRLESLVMKAIENDLGNPVWTYVNDEERAMIEEYEANVKTVVELINGIGDCYEILSDNRFPFYDGPATVSVQGFFDALTPLLQSAIDAFNQTT